MAREETDLPFGDAFGPGQLDTEGELAIILKLAKQYEGDSTSFDEAVGERFFPESNIPIERGRNVRLGMQESGYGLVDDDFHLTEIGEELSDLHDEENELYDRFATHVLRNHHGLKLIGIVDDIRAQGKTPTIPDIQQEFREQYDFHIDQSTSDISQMRAWLNKSGIIGTGHNYDINRAKLEELVGAEPEDILELSGLTEGQQGFLRALAAIDPQKPIPNSKVREIAEQAYGVNIRQKSIVNDVLKPLESAGYITYKNPSEVTGKPNLVTPTKRFEAEVLGPLLRDLSERIGVPRHVLRSSFSEIREQMDAEETYIKGRALETLAVKLGRLLGLNFVGWHVRGRNTGGSEVDVIMDAVGISFTRWQIQCKNVSGRLRTKHVKEEVGVARMVQSNVILMIARSGVSSGAQQFASRVMHRDNLTIMFLEGDDLMEFDENPDHLILTLRGEAKRVQRLKNLDERDMVEITEQEQQINRESETMEEYREDLREYQQPPEEEDKEGGLTEEGNRDRQNSLEDFSE